MSLDLLIGYTGLLSFGHAAFFGVSAVHGGDPGCAPRLVGVGGFVAGIAVSARFAALIGFFSIRVSGIPFLMLTMAFSQLLMSISVKWRTVTGGTDGLSGFKRPSLFGWSLDDRAVQFYVIAVGFVLVPFCPAPAHRVAARLDLHRHPRERAADARGRLPGAALQARFVHARRRARGRRRRPVRAANAYVSSDILHWSLSGDAIIMVILGGTGTIIGPVIGAGAFLLLKNVVSSHTDYWLLWVGIIFILCVMFLPQGVWGMGPCAIRGQARAMSLLRTDALQKAFGNLVVTKNVNLGRRRASATR